MDLEMGCVCIRSKYTAEKNFKNKTKTTTPMLPVLFAKASEVFSSSCQRIRRGPGLGVCSVSLACFQAGDIVFPKVSAASQYPTPHPLLPLRPHLRKRKMARGASAP